MMTIKEQIAKKAAKAAALATYKAILNPPVWKVAGVGFKTSPTWEDIAKAAAAASYSAVLKLAQQQDDKGVAKPPTEDTIVSRPTKDQAKNFGMIGLLKNQPKPAPGIDSHKAEDCDVGDAPVMEQIPVDVFQLASALSQAPNFAAWVNAYGKGAMPTDVVNFVNYVKSGGKGEKWASPAKWPEIVNALATQIGSSNPGAIEQLKAMMK
jgi:hypothetical protein